MKTYTQDEINEYRKKDAEKFLKEMSEIIAEQFISDAFKKFLNSTNYCAGGRYIHSDGVDENGWYENKNWDELNFDDKSKNFEIFKKGLKKALNAII